MTSTSTINVINLNLNLIDMDMDIVAMVDMDTVDMDMVGMEMVDMDMVDMVIRVAHCCTIFLKSSGYRNIAQGGDPIYAGVD